jgi:pyrroloquinoline quinone biosynthesis protein B
MKVKGYSSAHISFNDRCAPETMEITILGTASIGGVPEWDCTCPNCATARSNPSFRRTRAAVTISLDGGKHILIDAGHDIKTQLEKQGITPRPEEAGETYRENRLDSIFLTHGHADHTVGLAEFCTGKSFEIPLYAPPDLVTFLSGTEQRPNYFGDLGRIAKNYVRPIKLEENKIITRLDIVNLQGFGVKHTQVLENGRKYPSTTYVYEVNHMDKWFIYAPDIGELGEPFLNWLDGADVFMMDATFWWDDELERVSGIPVTSYQLGHVPQRESVEILKDINIERVIYTHINHTNPVIDSTKEYYKNVKKAGQEIAQDGLKIWL